MTTAPFAAASLLAVAATLAAAAPARAQDRSETSPPAVTPATPEGAAHHHHPASAMPARHDAASVSSTASDASANARAIPTTETPAPGLHQPPGETAPGRAETEHGAHHTPTAPHDGAAPHGAHISANPGHPMDAMEMPGMNAGDRGMPGMTMPGETGAVAPISAAGSGTARLPGAEGHGHGLSFAPGGGWMLMAHGWVQANYADYSGPRGTDLPYVTSMAMVTAARDWGTTRLTLKSMLSLEPLMDARGYPALFATGETAHGAPLVDRQHPHDLFMELAARLDIGLAPGASLFLYGGPVGEPALGPSVFLMRGSARNNPEPPISHHWFDSTHITYGVATAGLATRHWQVEASAFRGAEPDERRWGIETPRFDSWSVRLSWSPNARWTAQTSHGFLKRPEATHPGENEHRTTATLHYAGARLSAMAGFSAKNADPGRTRTAWIGEADYRLTARHSLFGRVENVDNAELFADHDDPLHDRGFRITKLEGGYAWHRPLAGPVGLTLGGSLSTFLRPEALRAAYGRWPWGFTLFMRLALGH